MRKKAKKSEAEQKESLLAKLSTYTDVSLCVFTDFKIEIERTGEQSEKSLTAYGSCGIRTLKGRVVALDYREEYLVIRGARLDCHAYADGAMNVRGRISSVSFCKCEDYHDEDT